MKYVMVFVLVVAAYVAGYLTPRESLPRLEQNLADESNAVIDQATAPLVASPAGLNPAKMKVEDKLISGGASVESVGDENRSDVSAKFEQRPMEDPNVSVTSGSGTAEYQPFTDAEIEALAPKPFSDVIKKMQDSDLARYRKFIDQQDPNDQDKELYNRLFDAITGNPYSKFIDIDSIQCKGAMCELRLYERKSGVWNYIQSEMILQGWWPFSYTSAYGLGTVDKSREALYVLLRKD